MSEAEELGYQETYFTTSSSPDRFNLTDGYISASPPITRSVAHRNDPPTPDPNNESATLPANRAGLKLRQTKKKEEVDRIAEMIVFDYGVVVFFGFEESQERALLEDLDRAMIMVRPRPEDKWEVEVCHYVVSYPSACHIPNHKTDPHTQQYDQFAPSPRIYNDFFSTSTP